MNCLLIGIIVLLFVIYIVDQSCEARPVSLCGLGIGAVLAIVALLFAVLGMRLLNGRVDSKKKRTFSFTAKWMERLVGLVAGNEDADFLPGHSDDSSGERSIAQLVTSTWGWSLIGLFAAIVLAYGILWHHPFYVETRAIDRTDFQEAIPFLIGAAFWVLWVIVSILVAILLGWRYRRMDGNFTHVRMASRCLLIFSAVVTIFLASPLGAVFATIINSFLLLLCLIYVSIATALRATGQKEAWLHTAGIALSILLCWVR